MTLFLGSFDLLEDLIDYSTGKQNTSSSSNGSQEVGQESEGSNAESSEVGGNVDISGELFLQQFLCSSIGSDVLVLKSLSNLFGTVSSDADPESGNQRTRDQNEGDVDDGMEWVLKHALD